MTESQFQVDDAVRIDIPDKSDPDYDFHREVGTVVEVLEDDMSEVTGDERDNLIYRVELEQGDIMDFRWRDLRPVLD